MGHYVGVLTDPESSDHFQHTCEHHLAPCKGDDCLIDAGRRDLDSSTIGGQLRIKDSHYAVMSFDEVRVLLQANYSNNFEEYDPKSCSPSSVLGARCSSYLNRRLGGKAPCRDYLVCMPITSTASLAPLLPQAMRREDEELPLQREPPDECQQLRRALHLRC